MHFLKLLFLAAAGAAASAVVPEAAQPRDVDVVERATCVYTCGSICYWQEDIDEALAQGYKYLKAGSAPGGYPHEYYDYEGFSFPTAGPWYEFPILSSYVAYTGGSPGADRVIFDKNGAFDSVITHTGASGNNFVACKKN